MLSLAEMHYFKNDTIIIYFIKNMAKPVNYVEVDDYEWNEWFRDGYDPGCSGIYGGCDYCLEKMYCKRSTYLTNYIKVFLHNKDVIVKNVVEMPKLRWYPAPTAKIFNVEAFHRERCNNVLHYWLCKQLFMEDIFTNMKKYVQFNNVNICSCDTALFLRCCYGYIAEDDTRTSLDQIWGRYKNMKKRKK